MFWLFLIYLLALLQTSIEQLQTDLAFQKPTYASSADPNFKPTYATDGSKRRYESLPGTTNNWLVVDLLDNYMILNASLEIDEKMGTYLIGLMKEFDPKNFDPLRANNQGKISICYDHTWKIMSHNTHLPPCIGLIGRYYLVQQTTKEPSTMVVYNLKIYEKEISYIGCFNKTYKIERINENFESNSVDECVLYCAGTLSTYVALKNRRCECVNSIRFAVKENKCSYTGCGNNRKWTDSCGGYTSFSIFSTCKLGFFGKYCQNRCECKNGAQCNRNSGKCETDCSPGWNGRNCETIIGDKSYIGCYSDNQMRRDLEKAIVSLETNLTIEACFEACSTDYDFFSLQDSNKCFCGSSYGAYERLDNSACSDKCVGNINQICGGKLKNSVYSASACPTGRYGYHCASSCHCEFDIPCYEDGRCPKSKCSPGWKGIYCELRNCLNNNGNCGFDAKCEFLKVQNQAVSICKCDNGFDKPNYMANCQDIDECLIDPIYCDRAAADGCMNTQGSYHCLCSAGYFPPNCSTGMLTNERLGNSSITPMDVKFIIWMVLSAFLLIICIIVIIICLSMCVKKKRLARELERSKLENESSEKLKLNQQVKFQNSTHPDLVRSQFGGFGQSKNTFLLAKSKEGNYEGAFLTGANNYEENRPISYNNNNHYEDINEEAEEGNYMKLSNNQLSPDQNERYIKLQK